MRFTFAWIMYVRLIRSKNKISGDWFLTAVVKDPNTEKVQKNAIY